MGVFLLCNLIKNKKVKKTEKKINQLALAASSLVAATGKLFRSRQYLKHKNETCVFDQSCLITNLPLHIFLSAELGENSKSCLQSMHAHYDK